MGCTPNRCIILRGWPSASARVRYGEYVLSVGRIESVKRVDLAVRALAHVDPRGASGGRGRGHTARQHASDSRRSSGSPIASTFLGAVDDETLLDLYADALAVVYAPFDEDYGYVTLEAFLARKPVITTMDAGGPLEFVDDGVNGAACRPNREAIAQVINHLAHAPARRGGAR